MTRKTHGHQRPPKTSHLIKDPNLAQFAGRVSDSGEWRWTIKAAIDEAVPAGGPVHGEGETGLIVYTILLRYWDWTPEEDLRPLIFLMSD
jgi:hypothetical protein